MKVDLGAQVLTKLAVAPVVLSETTLTATSIAIDRKGYESGVIVLSSGAASGAPDSFSVTATLQSCATSGGQYADVTDINTEAAITAAVTAASTLAEVGFRATPLERWLKVKVVAAFVAGTTPLVPVAAELVLGEAKTEPC
jgi:hypothetical protein